MILTARTGNDQVLCRMKNETIQHL